jgi:signal peptidase II
LKKVINEYFWLIAIAALIVLTDQLSKIWVRQNLAFGEVYHPEWWLSIYARLIHVKNTGIVFGLFPNAGGFFSLLPIIIGVMILFYYPRIPRQDWLIRLALGLYLGGAIGNLIDRLQFGHVTDFVSVGSFAVFNVADASLSIGAAILILGFLLQERRKTGEQAETNSDSPGS